MEKIIGKILKTRVWNTANKMTGAMILKREFNTLQKIKCVGWVTYSKTSLSGCRLFEKYVRFLGVICSPRVIYSKTGLYHFRCGILYMLGIKECSFTFQSITDHLLIRKPIVSEEWNKSGFLLKQ